MGACRCTDIHVCHSSCWFVCEITEGWTNRLNKNDLIYAALAGESYWQLRLPFRLIKAEKDLLLWKQMEIVRVGFRKEEKSERKFFFAS